MTETFPTISPDLDSKRSYTPRILRAEFGDGYLQAGADGINAYKESWALTFSNRQLADIEAIKTMLETCGGWQAFYWTPPGETALSPPKKWVQTGDFQYGKTGPDTYMISFTAERVQRP